MHHIDRLHQYTYPTNIIYLMRKISTPWYLYKLQYVDIVNKISIDSVPQPVQVAYHHGDAQKNKPTKPDGRVEPLISPLHNADKASSGPPKKHDNKLDRVQKRAIRNIDSGTRNIYMP